VGGPLGLSVEQAAEAAIRLANVHMTGAIRMVSLSKGHDPRDFVLFAFGGAGPLHAVALAREIGIPEVLVPARPGLTNALGCLVADLRQDLVNTLNRGLDDIPEEEIAATLATQRERGLATVLAEKGEVEDAQVLHSAEMQFRGQTHLIRVALPHAAMTRAEIQSAFEAAYFARFQIRMPEIRAVLVNLNTSVIGKRPGFSLAGLLPDGDGDPLVGERLIYADGAWHTAKIWQRERLRRGTRIAGPAIIQQADATTVLEPGSEAVVDTLGNLRIKVRA
jgi:N-methylhydantoinase A